MAARRKFMEDYEKRKSKDMSRMEAPESRGEFEHNINLFIEEAKDIASAS